MDARRLLPNPQRRTKKVQELKKHEIGRDIISDLPESVLTHILSFLPTKYVVQTSVLSTKWEDKWTKVTNLHFDDELLSSRKNMTRRAYFMNFVDRVLLHLDNSKIHSFYLSCDNYSDASRVSSWISAVIKRQVQKLDIKYKDIKCERQEFVVPRCVFGSNSLRELNLVAACIIKVSASCFSRLETLDISGVTFMNQCFPNTEEITMTFPVLKVLTLCCSTEKLNVKVVNLNVPALHSFRLETCDYGWVPDDSHDLLIKICGQNLKKFNYFSDCPENYVLDCASSVTEANISICKGSQQKTTVGLRACNILKMFVGVVNLTISWETIEVLHPLENLQALLPSYNNLVQLKVSSGKVVIDGTIMALLHNSPVLETLILDMDHMSYDLQFDKDAVQERVPQCFMSHLKVVELRQFQGNKHELHLAEFLLINAMVLEVMIITASQIRKWQVETKFEPVKKQLSTFPKGSRHAKILFS